MTESIDILIAAFFTASVTLFSVHLSNLSHSKREKEQFNRNEKQKKNDLYRIKLEELYILFYIWEDYVGLVYTAYIPVIRGTITEKDFLKITQENKPSKEDSHRRVNMIVHMYFPQLVNKLNKVLKSRDKLSNFSGKDKPKDGNTKEFLRAYKSFHEISKEFKEDIAEISKEFKEDIAEI